MLTSTQEWLTAELMDVVRLFPGAEEQEISHSFERTAEGTIDRYIINGESFEARASFTARTAGEEKSLIKRYAKLSLYRLLSARFHRELPWGSLTGIRPTRIAYREAEEGRDFRTLFRTLGVLEENTELVARVMKGQEGIYERKEGNCDLYVSLPFCPTKCDYCSFITAPIAKTRQYVPAYLDALERELSAAAGLIQTLRSVYVGGGTPFVLESCDLERVLRAIAPLRTNGCEYTVEAGRPDVFTREKLDLCAEYGVTRICINAQSFSDRTLRAIGRQHTCAQLYEAFELAKDYPFTVNCDLIAGLTGESVGEFRDSVERAIALAPGNITVHTLCLKKGAKLKEEHLPLRASAEEGARERTVSLLPEEGLKEMISCSRELLTAAGYEPYYLYRQKYMAGAHENVGWTKPGLASVYNVDVMEESADNLAVGSNAITKKLFWKEERIERLGSPKDLPTYLSKVGWVIEEKNKLFAK